MRIRWRLAAYGGVVAALAMFAFGLLLTLLARGAAPGDQDKNLASLAASTIADLSNLTVEQLSASPPLSTLELEDSSDEFVAVYSNTGSVWYTSGTVGGTAPEIPAAVIVEALERGSSVATIRAGEETELRISAHSTAIGGVDAVVVAGQSTAFITEQLTGLQAVVWIAATLTLVFSAVVSWLVSGRALRPLRDLATTSDEIGETGDLTRRLPPVRSNDEVGVLTRSYNQMLDRVEAAQTELADSLARQRRFVADASHELRSPLTTIRSNAGFLLDRTDAAAADRSEALSDIDAEAARMADLVDDLLELARADSGRPLERHAVDLRSIVYDLERRVSQLASTVHIAAADPVVVNADAAALTRLVWNLIDNASRHGGDVIDVAVSSAGGEAHLTVTDNGPGFHDEAVDRVFDRFYRADPARSPAGAGLGLAIARQIAASHGGTIEASNQPEGGARVDVVLPLGV